MATPVIVIQMQSYTVKVGVAGEALPRFIYNRAPSSSDLSNNNDDGKINSNKRLYYINLFQYAFMKKLCMKAKDAQVLVIEDIFELKADRDAMFSALLVDLGVASLSIQPDLFMPILTSTTTSGVVIDIGKDETKVLAVFQGRPLLQTLIVSQVGAVDVVKSFVDQVQRVTERTVPLNYTEAMKVLRDHSARALMQSSSVPVVSPASSAVVDPSAGLASVLVPLSASATVSESASVSGRPSPPVQVLLPALVFHTSLRYLVIGSELGQIAEAILNCLKACNSDVRATVLANIVVCGCLTDIPGIPESLCEEASSTLFADSDTSGNYASVRQTVRKVLGPEGRLEPAWTGLEREHLAWVGGSLFAAQKGNLAKFIGAQTVLAQHQQSSAGRLHAPDWMSVDPKDWSFYGRTSTVDKS